MRITAPLKKRQWHKPPIDFVVFPHAQQIKSTYLNSWSTKERQQRKQILSIPEIYYPKIDLYILDSTYTQKILKNLPLTLAAH